MTDLKQQALEAARAVRWHETARGRERAVAAAMLRFVQKVLPLYRPSHAAGCTAVRRGLRGTLIFGGPCTCGFLDLIEGRAAEELERG